MKVVEYSIIYTSSVYLIRSDFRSYTHNLNKLFMKVFCFAFKTDTDIDWVDLADDIRHEYYVVDNLRPSHGYKFRVLACNKFGWSIPSIPSAIAMTPSSGASKAEFYEALQVLQVNRNLGKKVPRNRYVGLS